MQKRCSLIFRGENKIILYYKLGWINGVNKKSLRSYQSSNIFCASIFRNAFFCYRYLTKNWLAQAVKIKHSPHVYNKVFFWLMPACTKSQNVNMVHLNMFSYIKQDFLSLLTVYMICHYLSAHFPWLNPRSQGNEAWSNSASLLTLILVRKIFFCNSQSTIQFLCLN